LAPATDLLAALRAKRVSSKELTDLYIRSQTPPTVDGHSVPYLHGFAYPAVSTVAGQPATAFPIGRSREGLPIGLQAIGPYLEDRTPIRFAALLAREIGGFTRPPGYDAS
jgi:Asp-tRNA(Asn)/Glu-tRNA(Gln) amidotransferase A subunit family amidase